MKVSSLIKNIAHFLREERAYSIPAGIVAVAVLLVVILPSGVSHQPAAASYAFDIVGNEPVVLDTVSFDIINTVDTSSDTSKNVSATSRQSWDTLTNGRPALIAFWASWCQNCRSALSDLRELDTIYHDDIAMIGVTIDEASHEIGQIWDESHMTFPNITNGKEIGKLLDVARVPTYVFLDAEGHIINILTHTPEIADVVEVLE